MTVRYIFHYSRENACAVAKLLFRFRGSLVKLIWRETLIFLALYYALTLVYACLLDNDQKDQFEKFSNFVRTKSGLIPITFILGNFVAFTVTDRWNQYFLAIPLVDRAALQINAYVKGDDHESRILRRTMARYLNLSEAFMLNKISPAFRKRFPTRQDMVPYLITENELDHISQSQTKYNDQPLDLYSLPIQWACALLNTAHGNGRISDAAQIALHREFMAFRGNLGSLSVLDWITIPLAYTQVVTISVYTFLLSTILGRPFDQYPKSGILDLGKYIPIFTVLRFAFYMGWLKVAETLFNPLGEDDDDFEINHIADRNLQISYALVDDFYDRLPDLEKDIFWDEAVALVTVYQKQGSKDLKSKLPRGSVEDLRIPINQQLVIDDPEKFKQLPSTLKRHSISLLQQRSHLSRSSVRSGRSDKNA